ncbi:MAG: hypothetical protein U9R74_01075 [Pseudomonadota bacterium]|nr:hypothetical protein [Pseudomonadota bacterium]
MRSILNLVEPGALRLQQGLCTDWEEADDATGATRGYRFTHQVPLKQAHPDLAVNLPEYREVDAKGKERIGNWITNLAITHDNAQTLIRAGRRGGRSRMRRSIH